MAIKVVVRMIWFGMSRSWLLNVWVTGDCWAPALVRGLLEVVLGACREPPPCPGNRVLVLNLVSCHSTLKEGRPLRVKIGLCHHENCVIFYQWLRGVEAVDSVKPSSGQWDWREIGQGDEFWKTFFSLVKRNFSFLRYCCMKIWCLEHWQPSCSHRGSKTKPEC